MALILCSVILFSKTMRHSFKVGLSFGTTSGIITTLGLMLGLHSSTHSTIVVIGGIVTIAVADSFSDALGIHISEESENKHTTKEIWESTVSTFICKLIVALSFIIAILVFELYIGIIVNVIWGLLLLCVLSFYIAKRQKASPSKVVLEHLAVAVMVLVAAHLLGGWIASICI